MTEAYLNPPPPLVPERFNHLPYCLPEESYGYPLDIVCAFNPEQVASSPMFLNHLSARYADHKAGDDQKKEEKRPGTFDMRDPHHLEKMTSHTLAHAIAGLVESGTSDTHCIPYWDREAVKAGLEYQDPAHATERLQVFDALSINALRSYCDYLRWSVPFYGNQVKLIDEGIARGLCSKKDMRPRQNHKAGFFREQTQEHTALYAAKLKHLLWLVDLQDPKTRWFMQSEIVKRIGRAGELGLTPDDLAIDLGVDAGISSETDRPPYDISSFMQLAHLHTPGADQQIYVLPQEDCHRLSINQMMTSIHRAENVPPDYQRDGRYDLPWIF